MTRDQEASPSPLRELREGRGAELLAALRPILEPFDDALGEDDEGYDDHTPVTIAWKAATAYGVTLGDLRRVRAMLRQAETTPSLPASGHGEVAGLVEELRAGLEGVTPEAWSYILCDDDRPMVVTHGDVVCLPDPNHGSSQGLPDKFDVLNFRHIARCSPDNIAKLLSHIDALTAQLSAPTPSPVEARADGVRELLTDILHNGLIYWEPQTTRGAAAKAEMVARVEAAIDGRPPPKKAWPIDTDDQVEALARECEWNNRVYMTPADYAIWCQRMRNFARLASLESTPAPVREGQEGKALAEARRCLERDQWCKTTTIDLATVRTLVNALASQLDQAAEIARLTRQLHSLAVALHRKHYADVPQWQPLPDAEGLLSQIDNMTTGLCRTARAERAESELAVIRSEVQRAVERLPMIRTESVQAALEILRAALANTADRGQEEKGK